MTVPHSKHISSPSARCLLIAAAALLIGCESGVNVGTGLSPGPGGDADVDVGVDQNDSNEMASPLDPIIEIGTVQTREVNGVLFTSLPDVTANNDQPSAELGRLLFWDPILSGDQDTACATCHLPEFGYGDGRARSVGTGGVGTSVDRQLGAVGQVMRNAPTVLNTVWNGINELGVFDTESAPMFWDSRTQSLVSQAIEPIHDREDLFNRAFGTNDITMNRVAQALSDFQSSLIANNAPFDRWVRGDTTALNDQQIQGLQAFAATGCADCHSGPMFSDYEHRVLGVEEASGLASPDTGDGDFAFRTPTLRQLVFTAPYFHGGQMGNLVDVVDFYDDNNRSHNPNVLSTELDPDFRDLRAINNNNIVAIEAFLESLSDPVFDRTRPDSVPSGLAVGGSL